MTPALLLALAMPLAAFWKPAAPAHPLEPLTLQEISEAVAVIKEAKIAAPKALFPIVTLQEPSKDAVAAFEPGTPFPRQAFAVVFDRDRNETSEAVVDLRGRKLASWRVIPAVQPLLLVEELTSVPAIMKADPRYVEALRKRGITDLSQVHIDPWAPGTIGVTGAEGPRLIRGLSFYKGDSSNFYSRPIEGLVAVVDMNARKVAELMDSGVVPLSDEAAPFDERSQTLRPQPKPLRVYQPDGPDFTLENGEVRWQKWRFRFSMHPREGLVLHQVGYEDRGRVRPVLHRASLSEMAVPYGDPDPAWSWRSALDEGEYGVGKLASPLDPGIDVPENARLIDAAFADDFGNAFTLPRAAAVYERDGGLLWKHYTVDTDTNESRRGRELVVTAAATVGNYDYTYSWIFKQDGSLHCEVGLTGIMLAKGVAPSTASAHDHGRHMHLVAPQVAAPHHQHFFNFRLDFDVDGATNTVFELETRALPAGKDNPYGNAMLAVETPLTTEKAARRNLEPAAARRWVVRNPRSLNRLGQPVGYAIAPGENTVPFLRPESPQRRRVPFINHHLWVTPFDPEQNYAAGDYPSQSAKRDGLERWTADDEPLEERDVVVWYTLGVTHMPRPEEWPIMPVAKAGFGLLPMGFFDANPALDVPRPVSFRRRKK